ncbi:MAG TPA: DUF445 domain-containing protein [Roseiflexaceae bacterium]|nr:DUF445 domain-containing protein [Roseiflexaceae bacterium]
MFAVDDAERRIELNRMKRLATGLLAVVTLAFVVASLFEQRYPWLGFVRATAEAAMVGAIADWFAVTALFRHPLGLPIPHTAIIPRRKDTIGAGIGRFVQENFLSEAVILGRLRSVDSARQVAHWISQPAHSARIAGLLTAAVDGILQVLNDADVQALIERAMVTRVRSIRAAPLAGQALAHVLTKQRQAELLYALLRFAARVMDANKLAIRERINRELPWWLPRSIDKEIYRRLVDAVETTLHEVSQDPAHQIHQQFNATVREFIEELQSNPDLIAKGEALKEELLNHPSARDIAATLWVDLKAWLREQSAKPDSEIQQSIQRAIVQFGTLILRDAALAEKVNQWIEQIALYAIREYGDEAAQLIEQTVRNWDAAAASQKIELQIGKDLQYIRINGTVVGGIAGLLIYCAALLIQL